MQGRSASPNDYVNILHLWSRHNFLFARRSPEEENNDRGQNFELEESSYAQLTPEITLAII